MSNLPTKADTEQEEDPLELTTAIKMLSLPVENGDEALDEDNGTALLLVRDNAVARRAGHIGIRLAINISSQELVTEGIDDRIAKILE